jgi:hypothetical protein
MSWEQILKTLTSEWAVIQGAPILFATGLLVLAGPVYVFLHWVFSMRLQHRDDQIAMLNERIRLRDDQLGNRLQAIPREEAQEMIKALQRRVDALTPRRVPDTTREAARSHLIRPTPGEARTIGIAWNARVSDTEELAASLTSLFRDAGWIVSERREYVDPIARGITLTLSDPEDATDRNVRETIERTGLPVHLRHDAAARFPFLQIGAREDTE